MSVRHAFVIALCQVDFVLTQSCQMAGRHSGRVMEGCPGDPASYPKKICRSGDNRAGKRENKFILRALGFEQGMGG
jgi:hypothetical protein